MSSTNNLPGHGSTTAANTPQPANPKNFQAGKHHNTPPQALPAHNTPTVEIHGDYHEQTDNKSPISVGTHHHEHTKTTTTNTAGLGILLVPPATTQNTVETDKIVDDVTVISGTDEKHTQLNIGGSVQFGQPKSNGAGQSSTQPHVTGRPAASASASHTAKPKTEDAIIIGSTDATLDAKDIDFTGSERANSSADVKQLTSAIKRLQAELPPEAHIKIKGLDLEKLQVLVQKDYVGEQESNITLSYTDHRDKSYNTSLGNVPITPKNIGNLTDALNAAAEAVHQLTHPKDDGKTGLSTVKAVSLDDINNTVQSTIKRQLATTITL